MDFMEIMKKRFASKKFEEKASEQEIRELLEIIRLSPSSYNSQPWRIFVVEGDEKFEKACYGQQQARQGHLLVFCIPKRDELVEELRKHNQTSEYAIDFILSLGEKDYECWAEKQVYIALGIAAVAAKAIGLDSCPMEGFDREEMRKLLNTEMKPVVVLAIGKKGRDRNGNREPSEKKRLPMETIAKWHGKK